MKTQIIFVICLCLTLFGCSFADDVSKAPDKDRIAQIQEPDKDYCAIHDWYGDGVCDEFCTNPDPDCAITCDGIPVCGSGRVEVDQCSNDQTCTEVSMCGITIFCEEVVACSAIGLACGPHQSEIDWCDVDEPGCTLYEDDCGLELYCFEEFVTCDAEPVCPSFTHEVTECHDQTECHRISMCGSTILCQQDAGHCEAYPTCPDGHVQVEQCPLDAECPTVFDCGYKAICMPDPACRAIPTCPEGSKEVDSCDDPLNCFEEYTCGQSITCAVEPAACLALPSCADREYHVSAEFCAQSDRCRTEVTCGLATHCMPVPDVCNDVVGGPPACGPNQTPTPGCSIREHNSGVCEATFGTGSQCYEYTYCRN